MCRIDQKARERFLTAYAEIRTVAGACRKSQIHRSTIYRWRSDPAFVTAMDAAWQAGYRRWYKEIYEPQERARQAARERRYAELKPIYAANLAKARSARRARRGW
jgi:hypothetical protein